MKNSTFVWIVVIFPLLIILCFKGTGNVLSHSAKQKIVHLKTRIATAVSM